MTDITSSKYQHADEFYVDGTQLPVVSSYRDLGLVVNKDLSPSEHITDIVVRAHRLANLIIHRCFVSRNVTLLLRAF